MPTRPDIETQTRKDQDEPQTGDSRPKKKKDREYGRGTPATQQTRREARRTDEFTDKSGNARTSAQVRGTARFSQCTLAAVRHLPSDRAENDRSPLGKAFPHMPRTGASGSATARCAPVKSGATPFPAHPPPPSEHALFSVPRMSRAPFHAIGTSSFNRVVQIRHVDAPLVQKWS